METIEKQFITLRFTANSYMVREDTMDGKRHLVVPVVMMWKVSIVEVKARFFIVQKSWPNGLKHGMEYRLPSHIL